MSNAAWGNPVFDSAYLASLPLPVQSALGVTFGSGQNNFAAISMTTALALAGQGYFVDEPIMVWGIDPFVVMSMRVLDGVKTYPDLLDTQTKTTSTNPTDYPPTPIPAPPQGVLVGAPLPGSSNCFYPTTLATELNLPAGYIWTENGHTYTAFYVTQQQPLSGQTQQILRWLQAS